jgi:hypothetical protein
MASGVLGRGSILLPLPPLPPLPLPLPPPPPVGQAAIEKAITAAKTIISIFDTSKHFKIFFIHALKLFNYSIFVHLCQKNFIKFSFKKEF